MRELAQQPKARVGHHVEANISLRRTKQSLPQRVQNALFASCPDQAVLAENKISVCDLNTAPARSQDVLAQLP